MHIRINDLSFKYYKSLENTIDNLSLEIKNGEIMMLLGLNGCGKTTLIKLLAGLLPYDSGSIFYDEKELKNINISDRSKIFAYVPQTSNVVNDFSAKEYLTYGFANSLKFYQRPRKEQEDAVVEISKKLQIEKLLAKKMGKISGGEKQIVTIASCLLQNTPIILLDEPTSALDLKNQYMILSLLKEISKEGKTIILSSHNPNHALFLESNVVLMDKGKIVKIGQSKDLIKAEILKDIYGDKLCNSKELPFDEISFKF